VDRPVNPRPSQMRVTGITLRNSALEMLQLAGKRNGFWMRGNLSSAVCFRTTDASSSFDLSRIILVGFNRAPGG
jgi:hypothetical protein